MKVGGPKKGEYYPVELKLGPKNTVEVRWEEFTSGGEWSLGLGWR